VISRTEMDSLPAQSWRALMHEIGLYHPRIHFQSEKWIKAAALYWTKMARIVPSGYVPHDSDTVRILRDELDFVVNLEPQKSGGRGTFWDGACHEFLDFVGHHTAELLQRYRFDEHEYSRTPNSSVEYAFGSEPWADKRGEPLVAEIADAKLAGVLRGSLIARGLAYPKPRDQLGRSSLLMHPDLARVYMSALAEDLARANHLRPTTDDHDVFAVGGGWTEDRMRNLLLTSRESRPRLGVEEYRSDRFGSPDMIGMIAIQAVVPQDIGKIPTKKIVEIKKSLTPQFLAFRGKVDVVANEISQNLEGIQDPAIIRAYLEQEVHDQLLIPAQELRNEMHQLNIDTTTAMLTFKYQMPAVAGLFAAGILAHQPLLAGGAAAAVSWLGLARGARRDATARQAESPVSYLMLLEDGLEARSTLQRATRQIRKITGLI
jgi:hypothetical protein